MNGGDSAHVSAILAETAEVGGAEETNSETELVEETRVEELLEDVLFLHARGVESHVVPFLEKRDGPIVGTDVVESSVYQVSFYAAVHTYLHIQGPVVA